MTSHTAIIVASGKGQRMGGNLPKQFTEVAGKPVLMRTIEAFYRYSPRMQLLVALPCDRMEYWYDLCQQYSFKIAHTAVAGGETRFQSVKNGLQHAVGKYTAVHDGVRPFVSPALISACFAAAQQYGAAAPVTMPVETVRQIGAGGENRLVARQNLRLMQTPQVFDTRMLKEAYAAAKPEIEYTDDASVVEALGKPIYLIEGERENIKLTTPFDMLVAEAIAAQSITDR